MTARAEFIEGRSILATAMRGRIIESITGHSTMQLIFSVIVLNKYFDDESATPSLRRFYLSNPNYIINNTNFSPVVETWKGRFSRAALDRGIKISNEQPDWCHIVEKILKLKFNDRTTSKNEKACSNDRTTISIDKNRSSSRPSSGTSNGSTFLTEFQKASFEAKYENMAQEKMWEVEEGVFVEKKMYEYGITLPYEHGVHSFILNVADPCWEKVFTESQLKKIKMHNLKPLPPLQQELKDFFKSFKNLTDVDQIWEVAEKAHFHPVKQFDLDFSKRMILDIVSSYRWGHVYRTAVSGGERDLIMLIWRAIDMCFQNLQVDALRSDQQTLAGSAGCNENRLCDDGHIKPKVSACKPDLILKKEQMEYGASENGGADEAGIGSKELIEKYIKLPKKLKDMALRLAADLDNEEKKIRKLQIIGILNTHLRMSSVVLDMPAGYVCRITPLVEQKVGATLEESFYKNYLRFLEQIIRLKSIVKDSIDVVTGANDDDDDDSDTEDLTGYLPLINSKTKIIIPSALNTDTTKKRKLDDFYLIQISSIFLCITKPTTASKNTITVKLPIAGKNKKT
ncbi:hypothetical protein BDC45DRAFT_532449 [Circinella umbellata]|nr:hypothetical protein BDC45DRAFT_532449 [Circinella umbellata]